MDFWIEMKASIVRKHRIYDCLGSETRDWMNLLEHQSGKRWLLPFLDQEQTIRSGSTSRVPQRQQDPLKTLPNAKPKKSIKQTKTKTTKLGQVRTLTKQNNIENQRRCFPTLEKHTKSLQECPTPPTNVAAPLPTAVSLRHVRPGTAWPLGGPERLPKTCALEDKGVGA